jgi:hypothetical protein
MSTSAPRVDSFESGSDVKSESSSQEANQKSETVSIDDGRRSIEVMTTLQKPIRQEWKASRPIRMPNSQDICSQRNIVWELSQSTKEDESIL